MMIVLQLIRVHYKEIKFLMKQFGKPFGKTTIRWHVDHFDDRSF